MELASGFAGADRDHSRCANHRVVAKDILRERGMRQLLASGPVRRLARDLQTDLLASVWKSALVVALHDALHHLLVSRAAAHRSRHHGLRSNSGNLAIMVAIRLASSRVNQW